MTSKKVSVWYATEWRNETLSWQAQIQIISVRIVCIAYGDTAPSVAVSMIISTYMSPSVVSGVIERDARANPQTRLH